MLTYELHRHYLRAVLRSDKSFLSSRLTRTVHRAGTLTHGTVFHPLGRKCIIVRVGGGVVRLF